jgi:hypothetical protein
MPRTVKPDIIDDRRFNPALFARLAVVGDDVLATGLFDSTASDDALRVGKQIAFHTVIIRSTENVLIKEESSWSVVEVFGATCQHRYRSENYGGSDESK